MPIPPSLGHRTPTRYDGCAFAAYAPCLLEESEHVALERARGRLGVVMACFVLAFVAVALRLADVTLLEAPAQIAHREAPPAFPRADIVDHTGAVLATTLTTASVYVHPHLLRDPMGTAYELAAALEGVNPEKLAAQLTRKGAKFVWAKRHVTPEEQQAVNALGILGVEFEDEQRRVYPYGRLFAHVLGYVDIDNHGLAGVEQYFDGFLAKPVAGETPEEGARPSLRLSLDARIQSIVHDELSQAVNTFSALGGVGLVLDVKTGELRGMVSLPDFDPHAPNASPQEAKFNRATLGVYEMGSTFKPLTAAMALDAGATTMEGGFDATNPIFISRFRITDFHPERRWLSTPEIIQYSSNIGTAKMAMAAGTGQQIAFLKKLGMLDPVELEVPERPRPLYPALKNGPDGVKRWGDVSTMTISYGHGMAVTPLQMVRALAALINGGVLHPLTLLSGSNADVGGERVIRPETSYNVRGLLRLVVTHGTGKKSEVPGYLVGGKTGTAEKNQGGRYGSGRLSSFISAFPMHDPRYVVLIMLDEPQPTKETYGYATGGWTAAPTAGRIIARLVTLLGMEAADESAPHVVQAYWHPRPEEPAAPGVKVAGQ